MLHVFGPADLSGRVGINNLLLPDVQDGLEGKDFSDAMVMSGLGPVVGILTNTFKGLAEIGQGHGMRGVETMSPVFLRSPCDLFVMRLKVPRIKPE